MGRAGVTLVEVEEAALQLQGRGKYPSVDAVREVIGSGSKATIAKHLRDWKAKEAVEHGKLPHELQALVVGLWERLNGQADQRIQEIEEASLQVIQELKQNLSSSQQAETYLKTQASQLENAYIQENKINAELSQQLQREQGIQITLNERLQALTQQLEASKIENDKLHQLSNHIQKNLEHYQQAMQQLRIEQTLASEKLQTRFQQEIKEYQQQLSVQNKKNQTLENELIQKNLVAEQLQQQYKALQDMHQQLTYESQNNIRELIIYKDRTLQLQNTIQINEEKLENKIALIHELEKQIAIQTDQLQRLQHNLTQAEDKIETLRHDNLFLAQEKSTLEGVIKSISAMEKTGKRG